MRFLRNLNVQQSRLFHAKKALTWETCFKEDPFNNIYSATKPIQSYIEHEQRLQSKLFNKCMTAKKIKLLVGDLSGTFTDPFSIAPVLAIVKAFQQVGVSISNSDVRKEMGLPKDQHIKSLLGYPEVVAAFERDLKRPCIIQQDGPAIYEAFQVIQIKILDAHNFLLPGVKGVAKALRRKGIAIGLTTGFPRQIVNPLLQGMAKQGFLPDYSVASDDIKHGQRPYPHMIHENMKYAGVHNPTEVIKCGDTPSDCAEGISARTWLVGFYGFANGIGVNSLKEYYHLLSRHPEELQERRQDQAQELIEAGAHYVVSGPSNLPAVCVDIHKRLADNQTPAMCEGLAREQSLLESRLT